LGDVEIKGAVIQIGEKMIDGENWDWSEVNNNPFWCPDAKAAKDWENYLDDIRKSGNSVGAILEVRASNVPAGWGAPVYGKLDRALPLAGLAAQITRMKFVWKMANRYFYPIIRAVF